MLEPIAVHFLLLFTNRKNQSGINLDDTNQDSESKTLSVEQKIFSGFKGINTGLLFWGEKGCGKS